MTIALVSSTKAGGLNSATTPGIDTTGANLIVVGAAYQVSSSAVMSDSKGNTYTGLTADNGSGSNAARIFYCASPTVGSGHTFTITDSGSAPAIAVAAFSGAHSSPFDMEPTSNSDVGSITSLAMNTITPAADNELLISVLTLAGVNTPAVDGGYTIAQHQVFVGGTNYGVDLAYLIQTAGSNSACTWTWGSGARAATVGAAFKPSVATITISTPTQYQTMQRSGGGTASIAITGTYTGAPSAIEASFNGGSYATIDASPSAGSYSGTLTSQAAGQGTLSVRFTNDTAVVATVADVGIGDVFILAGDSIAEGRGTNAQSFSHATLKAAVFKQNDAWALANDPIDQGTVDGSHWPLLATYLMADQSVPMGFVTTATGSTDVYGSGSNQWAKNNSAYAELISQATAATTGANGFKGILFHLGPNAIVNGTTPTQANYNAAIDQLVSDLTADVTGAPKVAFAICGEVGTGSPTDRRAAEDHVRFAIMEAWGDNANVKPGPVLIEQNYADDVHPASDAQLLTVAKRWWIALKEGFYGGASGFGRGPRLVSATINSALDTITVMVDRDLATGTTYGGFRVTDSGTPATITSATRFSTRVVRIVLSAPASALANVLVYFASGDDAVGQTVPTATAITLP